MSRPDISNLQNCIENVRQAGLDQDPGPADPLQFDALRGRLQAARSKMPPLYLEAVFTLICSGAGRNQREWIQPSSSRRPDARTSGWPNARRRARDPTKRRRI